MSQDISFIREELKNCEEVDTYNDLEIGNHVKYITINLKDNNEYFYTGGIYEQLGENMIYLRINGIKRPIPISIKQPDGNILYKTRLFVLTDKNECCKDKDEYEKIIHTQQRIIEKLNLQLKKQTKIINQLKNE